MNKYKIIISQEAEDILTASYDYLYARNPLAAVKWLDGMLQTIQSLDTFPEQGAIIPEASLDASFADLHQIFYTMNAGGNTYRIIYKITNDVNDKVYIGQTNNLLRRLRQHSSEHKFKALFDIFPKVDIYFFWCDSCLIDEIEKRFIIGEAPIMNRIFNSGETGSGNRTASSIKGLKMFNFLLDIEWLPVQVYLEYKYKNKANSESMYQRFGCIDVLEYIYDDLWIDKNFTFALSRLNFTEHRYYLVKEIYNNTLDHYFDIEAKSIFNKFVEEIDCQNKSFHNDYVFPSWCEIGMQYI